MAETNDGRLTHLDEQECWELLGIRSVGRVAFVDMDGAQQLLPVNLAVRDRKVFVRTSTDSVIGTLAQGHDRVALQTDHVQDLFQLAWSVTVTGSMGEVTDADLIEELREAGRPAPWAPGPREVFLVLTPRTIAGRRVRQH